MGKEIFVTIAVITRNRSESLAHTLAALNNISYNLFEIIAVDNGSTDNTKDIIQFHNCKYIYSSRSEGFSRSRQKAVDAASGEIILWCDDDCIPEENWIESYIAQFETDSKIALLGGKVINVNFPSYLKFKGTEIMSVNAVLKPVENPEEAVYFANLNMAVRTSFVREIGGYDPFFIGGYEEIDLNLSLRKAGFKVQFASKAIVKHYHQSIAFKKGRLFYGGQLMRLYLYFKHKDIVGNKQFLRNETRILFLDIYQSCRIILSGIKRFKMRRVTIGCVELFNSLSSRLCIPFLLIKIKCKTK